MWKFVRLASLVGLACMVDVRPCGAADDWPRVNIQDIVSHAAVKAGLDNAAEWLNDERCRHLFAEFRGENQDALAANLTRLNMSGSRYLSVVLFHDGTPRRECAGTGRTAFTVTGSRIVYICGANFLRVWRDKPGRATAILIHEVLHTLGLGENPPTSEEITQRVLQLCERGTAR